MNDPFCLEGAGLSDRAEEVPAYLVQSGGGGSTYMIKTQCLNRTLSGIHNMFNNIINDRKPI